VVYLDDIVIYSKTMEEHVQHLRTVFKVLRKNELYVKKENLWPLFLLGAQNEGWKTHDG
jgi:hypothetical protein